MHQSLLNAISSILFHAVPVSAQFSWPEPSDVGGVATLPEGGTDKLLGAILARFLEFCTGAVILVIIYAGYLYMSEIENKEATAKAKKLLTYAIAGYVVVVLAFSIINVALGLPLFSQEGTLEAPEKTTPEKETPPPDDA